MRRIHVVLPVLALCLLTTITVTGPVPLTATSATPQTGAPNTASRSQDAELPAASLTGTQPTSASQVFLPAVLNDYRFCPLTSPFSIQIAALHQIVPDARGTPTVQPLTESEWLALYGEAFPTLVQALKESGACWSRVGINWSWIQPEAPPAGYVWGPYHDEKLALVASSGVRLIATVGSVPYWARGEPYPDYSCTLVRPDRLDEFAQFLTDLVNRYKNPPWNIHHWELFNEPDGTRPLDDGWGCGGSRGDLYAQMLAAAYPAIKAADPTATVLMGGLAYDWFIEYGGPFYRYFPDEVMQAGGAPYVDAVGLHYFPDFHAEWERWVPEGDPPTCGNVEDGIGQPYEAWGIDLIAKTKHLRNRLSTCEGVNKPIWVTELADHGKADDAASLVQQARYVFKGYARGLAAGAKNITWFALVSPPYDNNGQGLLFKDLTPKPAYHTYQILTDELSGYQYAYTGANPLVEAYVFRHVDKPTKTVAWGSAPLAFTEASRLRVVDREGNVTFVDDGGAGDVDGLQNGIVVLQMTDEPVIVSR